MSKINIGVILFTRIGTKTSMLQSEFLFWNDVRANNPDCEFLFITITKIVTDSLNQHKHLLNFDPGIITIYSREDYHKLNNLSGVFSYLTRNTFFGGKVDPSSIKNYAICAHCTKNLNIPLFIRMPDSEYPYVDYKRLIDNRLRMKPDSEEKFRSINNNGAQIDNLIEDVNHDYVYFVANGYRQMCEWVLDAAYFDNPDYLRMMTPEEISKRTFYVPDEILFNLNLNREKFKNLGTDAQIGKLIFIGFLKGTVSERRQKALTKMLSIKEAEIPIDIIGPGADLLTEINREDVSLQDRSIFGDEFFRLLNSYLAYIFIGKGNSTNKYINKTIYDCVAAKCPIVVYRPCDITHAIFKSDEFYFTTQSELRALYEKLKDPVIRNRWIEEQRAEIQYKIENYSEPLFRFSDYCEPKSEIKITRSLPLF